MATSDILPYIDHLEDLLNDLEESLNASVLPTNSVAAVAKKLTLVDRAKLHVTVVYAIESLIFSYLRLHDVSPHAHPVIKELARVKSYFGKIKEAEEAPTAANKRPDVSLDKAAAGRVIKHALSGNRKIDLEAAEKKAREALLAKRRLKAATAASPPKPPADAALPPPPSESVVVSGEDESVLVPGDGVHGGGDDMEDGEIEEANVPTDTPTKDSSSNNDRKEQKLTKKERKRQREAEAKVAGAGADAGAGAGDTPRQAKKKRKNSSVAALAALAAGGD